MHPRTMLLWFYTRLPRYFMLHKQYLKKKKSVYELRTRALLWALGRKTPRWARLFGGQNAHKLMKSFVRTIQSIYRLCAGSALSGYRLTVYILSGYFLSAVWRKYFTRNYAWRLTNRWEKCSANVRAGNKVWMRSGGETWWAFLNGWPAGCWI